MPVSDYIFPPKGKQLCRVPAQNHAKNNVGSNQEENWHLQRKEATPS